jgi:hypothetical protein
VPRARCSPLVGSATMSLPDRRTRLAHGKCSGQLQVVVHVAARRRLAALCAARLIVPLPERSPTAVPWRERPPEMAASPAKPAASDKVAHATAERVLAPRASTVSPVEVGGNFDPQPVRNLMDFSTLFSHWSRPSDLNG